MTGDEVCWAEGEVFVWDCITTIGAALTAANAGGTTLVERGVDINSGDTSGIAAALAAVKASDFVILSLGIDKVRRRLGRCVRGASALVYLCAVNVESSPWSTRASTVSQSHCRGSRSHLRSRWGGRGCARRNKQNRRGARQVLALGKPTALVLCNGGQLAIDTLMAAPAAIVEAFNPSVTGATPLAQALFGQLNRWGRLPYTMCVSCWCPARMRRRGSVGVDTRARDRPLRYPANYVNEIAMDDFDMTAPPGRTYRCAGAGVGAATARAGTHGAARGEGTTTQLRCSPSAPG